MSNKNHLKTWTFYVFMILMMAVLLAFTSVSEAEVKEAPYTQADLHPPYTNSITKVSRWHKIVKREAQAVFGIDAPVPLLLGQITQESGGDENVTAWDGGMGLTQFMPATVKTMSGKYADLGEAKPYNPIWAARAQARYDQWLYSMVKGNTPCQRWGAALKGYNAGQGYVLKAQKKSPDPGVWFNVTEHIESGQSPKNFEYSRLYPRWILFKHQPKFALYGPLMCNELMK